MIDNSNEPQKEKNDEAQELADTIIEMNILSFINENKFLNNFIDIIGDIINGKQSLEFLRDEIVEIRDWTDEFLEIHQDDLSYIIKLYENKEELSEFENDVLKELKEMKKKT
jgi:hypothetical protein